MCKIDQIQPYLPVILLQACGNRVVAEQFVDEFPIAGPIFARLKTSAKKNRAI
jgi:hypothetical protein